MFEKSVKLFSSQDPVVIHDSNAIYSHCQTAAEHKNLRFGLIVFYLFIYLFKSYLWFENWGAAQKLVMMHSVKQNSSVANC